MRIVLAIALPVSALLLGASCSGIGDAGSTAASIVLDADSITLHYGEALPIAAVVQAATGDTLRDLPIMWSSSAPAVISVVPITGQPAATLTGEANTIAVVDIEARVGAVVDTVHAVLLPTSFPGTVSVIGDAGADTATVGGQPYGFSAGDTIMLTPSPPLEFDTNATTVELGPYSAYLVKRTRTEVRVLARGPYLGRPAVSRVLLPPAAGHGIIVADDLFGDSTAVQRARFRGVVQVTSDPSYGGYVVLTLTASPGTAFANNARVVVGDFQAITLSRSASTLTALAPVTITGTVLVRYVLVGQAVIDSLRGAPISIPVLPN